MKKENKNTTQLKALNAINDTILKAFQENKISIAKPSFKVNEGQYIDGAYNYATGYQYTGVNYLLLPPGFYLTFNQIKEMGGTFKPKDERKHGAYKVVKACITELITFKEEKDGEEKTTTLEAFKKKYGDPKDAKDKGVEIIKEFIKCNYIYFNVFNIEDIDGLPKKDFSHLKIYKKKPFQLVDPSSSNRDVISDLFLDNYLKREGISYSMLEGSQQSFYDILNDKIYIKDIDTFDNCNLFYEQFFHECAHSTGAENRLKRDSLNSPNRNRGQYCVEEIIAETTACYCLRHLGLLTYNQFENCKNYLLSYFNTDYFKDELNENPKLLAQIFTKSYQAFEYIFKRNK